MRFQNFIRQLLIGASALGAAFAAHCVQAQDPQRSPATPERSMFKGRLASVDFSLKVEPKRRVIALNLIVDAAWAMGPYDQEIGPRMARIVTDWPVGDLSALSSANYVETINAMLGEGVRLGEAYIVTSHHPGAYGPELLTIELASKGSEERFLAENMEYILNSRWFYDRLALHAKLSRLVIVRQEIRRLDADLKEMPADARSVKTWEGLIDSKMAAGLAERDKYMQEVSSTIGALKEEQTHIADALERQYLVYRIKDAEQTLADLKAFTFTSTP